MNLQLGSRSSPDRIDFECSCLTVMRASVTGGEPLVVNEN